MPVQIAFTFFYSFGKTIHAYKISLASHTLDPTKPFFHVLSSLNTTRNSKLPLGCQIHCMETKKTRYNVSAKKIKTIPT